MDIKPGWKSSEFWLRLLAKALGACVTVTSMQALHDNPYAQAAGMVCGGALMLLGLKGYSEERTNLKLAALRADIKSTTPAPEYQVKQ